MLCSITIPSRIVAQEWEYRNTETSTHIEIADMANGVSETYICCNRYGESAQWAMQLVALDNEGDTLWTRMTEGNMDIKGFHVCVSADGKVFVSAARWDEGWESFVQAWDIDGRLLWTYVVPKEHHVSMLPKATALLYDGTLALSLVRERHHLTDGLLVFLDSEGELRKLHDHDGVCNVLLPVSTGVLGVGWTRGTTGRDSHFISLSSEGTVLYSRAFDIDDDDEFTHVVADAEGISAAGVAVDKGNVSIPFLFRSYWSWAFSVTKMTEYAGTHRIMDIGLLPGGRTAMTFRVSTASAGTDAQTEVRAEDGTLLWTDRHDADGVRNDMLPPRFAGVSGALPDSSGMMILAWLPAKDETSVPDELRYLVYLAESPGQQDFDRADAVVANRSTIRIEGLLEGHVYYCIVRVRDAAGNTDSNTREIAVSTGSGMLRILTTDIPRARVGEAYTARMQAAGGLPPYSWSLADGYLPESLLFDENGELTGMPDSAGMWTLRVLVTDARSDTASRTVTLFVDDAQLRILTSTLPDAQLCRSYAIVLQATGGRPPYSWSRISGTLPDGIVLHTDGSLTGEALLPGSFSFTLLARDEAGDTASVELTLLVLPAPRLFVSGVVQLPAGRHCFSTVEIASGGVLSLAGPLDLVVHDSLLIDGLLQGDCSDIRILDYSTLRVRGSILDTCDNAQDRINTILFYSENGHILIDHGAEVITDADAVFTTDTTLTFWDDVVPQFARSSVLLDPVCSISADDAFPIMVAGDTVLVTYSCRALDPDGGSIYYELDAGDGRVYQHLYPEEEEEFLEVSVPYTQPGEYTVTLTAYDDDGASAQAHMSVVIADAAIDTADGFALSCEAGAMLLPVNDSTTFQFMPQLIEATVVTVDWDLGDGRISNVPYPVVAYSIPGRYDVSCTAVSDKGHTATASFSLYVYSPDSTTTAVPIDIPSAFAQSGVERTALVDAPLVVRRRIVWRGFTHLQFGPNASVRPRPLAVARPGFNGRGGLSLNTSVPNGWLILDQATFRAGHGGNGGPAQSWSPSGGKGGRGGSLTFTGRNILITGGSFEAGDGGKGADANVFVPAEGTARATGRAGGNAGHHVRFRAANSISITGPVTLYTGNGGDGGSATATGGPGMDRCNTGQNGANALSRGGRGGSARKQGIVRGNVSGASFITLSGGQGGNGGNAVSTGGKGGNANNCKTTAVGGRGGWARAFGGDGGPSGHQGVAFAGADNFKPGNSGNASATPGDGGDANAIPEPDKGADACPGEAGGSATAIGGKGGDGRAISGKKGKLYGRGIEADPGTATTDGSSGGHAAARGGDGGNGVGAGGSDCNCDGGNGGDAQASGGSRGSTYAKAMDGGNSSDNPGKDGNAEAHGGNGGNGGHCCTPPAASGGDGGDGGNASAATGPHATSSNAYGGNGGDGGDGKGPGVGGQGGTAVQSGAAGVAHDGADGSPGEWCFIISTWYIYFSSIPDGPLLPGTDVTLGTYPAQTPTNQTGTVVVHVMTQLETGFSSPPFVEKIGPELNIESGGLRFDLFTIQDIQQPGTQWNTTKMSVQFTGHSMMNGTVSLIGRSGGEILAEQHQPFAGPLPHIVSITAPEGTHFDTVELVSNESFSISHWEVEIVVVDP